MEIEPKGSADARNLIRHCFKDITRSQHTESSEGQSELEATIQWLHDLETELIEGRPEIALESIRGAIKIYQKSL